MTRPALAATIVATLAGIGGPSLAQDDPLVGFEALAPDVAQRAAQAALDHCTAEGFQVGVHVVDRFGTPQVFLRERFAGAHVYETSFRKAWTAASFGIPSTELGESTGPESDISAIRDLEQALALGGGLPVTEGGGSLVGAIGVSGAPTPALDDECAQAGIDAIFDDIAF
jgi:uncharacterized protein GlcG (DUF336 family)